MLTAADAPRIAAELDLGVDAAMTGPVARGVIGQIWRLDTDQGTWAIKEWFEQPDRAELTEGVAFQEAAMAAGVPAPPVVRATDGAWAIDVRGELVRAQGWVDLLDADPTIDAAAVGRLVATLHQVRFSGSEPEHEWYTEPIGADRWDALTSAARIAGAPFADQLAARRDDLVALDALVVPPGPTRTCHRDLWSDNLRTTAGGYLCLIDWEDCGLADPSMELALVLWEFCRTDPVRARTLHDAYVETGGPGRVRARSDFSMLIAQLGHIGARACADWLGAETEDARAFATSWFAEFVEDPHTIGQIDGLLDAIGS